MNNQQSVELCCAQRAVRIMFRQYGVDKDIQYGPRQLMLDILQGSE